VVFFVSAHVLIFAFRSGTLCPARSGCVALLTTKGRASGAFALLVKCFKHKKSPVISDRALIFIYTARFPRITSGVRDGSRSGLSRMFP
jgi:hypothetical protein